MFGLAVDKQNSKPDRTITICYNTRLTTFIQLVETVRKVILGNRSQTVCHTILDGCNVHKMCFFLIPLQAGKLEEVNRNQIRRVHWLFKNRYAALSLEFAASTFQSSATLVEYAGYVIAIGSKLSGRMNYLTCRNEFLVPL